MPVGTQGTLKGMLPAQIEAQNCNLILANTYHLGMRPGTEVINKAGGLHKFMRWNNALLTVSWKAGFIGAEMNIIFPYGPD